MKPHSRRAFLQGLALSCFPLSQALASRARKPFFERVGLPIGLQLYTLGNLLEKDFHGTLKSVAAIGYRTVELAGFGDRAPRDWRAALDAVRLKCTSIHISPRSAATEKSLSGDLNALAADVRVLGAEYIVMPSFERLLSRMTQDDWKRNARFLNERGASLRKLGLRLAYHNHNFEFRPLGATTGLAILLNETDPESVQFEMDVGWVAAAGHDPIKWLAEHPGRFRLMHVKDIKASTRPNFAGLQDGTEVGSGILNWNRLLPAAYRAGVRHYFVEQEPPFVVSPIRSVSQSYSYLKQA